MLFDMDGTLVDSTRSVVLIWTEWAERHGVAVEKILAISHGRRTVDTLGEIAPHLDVANEARMLEEQELESKEGIEEVPGARALLASLPLERWSVVTSASRALAEARLALAGLPVPPVLICSSDVAQGKPDPAGYLLAAAALGIAPSDCLVLEDTPAGLEAGRRAGAQILALTTTFSGDLLPAATCIPDFRNLRASVQEGHIHLQLDKHD